MIVCIRDSLDNWKIMNSLFREKTSPNIILIGFCKIAIFQRLVEYWAGIGLSKF